MTSKIGGYLTKKATDRLGDKVLGDFKESFTPGEPFYYKQEPGGKKKRKKSKYRLPGVSEHDNKVLASVRRRAWALDMCLLHCCGFRIGWAAVIGLVPVVGDVIGFLLALWVIRKASEIEGGLPPMVRSKMYFFATVDVIGGSIPFFGDVFDAIYKANSRNTWLLEDYLVRKAKAEREGMAGVVEGDPEIGMAGLPRHQEKARTNGGR